MSSDHSPLHIQTDDFLAVSPAMVRISGERSTRKERNEAKRSHNYLLSQLLSL